ncbi:MAG: sigma-70 family RNA polymerase sigma factor [Phycisphaerales bacterium]|nr:MAG: sigma-70 family RNA polymerase sigma factor [Phycisphaerales bacterium]
MAEISQTQRWISEAQRGDRLAVSKLLAVYHPMLRARVRARMDPGLQAKSEPEDILQQAYLEVFRHIEQFEDRGPDSFLNWVLTITDNKLVDAQRALHRLQRDVAREVRAQATAGAESHFNLLDRLYADSRTPSGVVRREEAAGALMACISRLSDSHRNVIKLRFLDGRPVGEVAEELGKSEAAVIALTKRALDALRKCMDRLGEFTRIS